MQVFLQKNSVNIKMCLFRLGDSDLFREKLVNLRKIGNKFCYFELYVYLCIELELRQPLCLACEKVTNALKMCLSNSVDSENGCFFWNIIDKYVSLHAEYDTTRMVITIHY